jgi:hypothetical protein
MTVFSIMPGKRMGWPDVPGGKPAMAHNRQEFAANPLTLRRGAIASSSNDKAAKQSRQFCKPSLQAKSASHFRLGSRWGKP